jgi:hypothetical protein
VVAVDFSTYVRFGKNELVQCHVDDFGKYMDINSQSTFQLPGLENDAITFIDSNFVKVDRDILRNVKTDKKSFVFNETQGIVFTLNKGEIVPISVSELEHFEHHFGICKFENSFNIFSKKTL